jgi:putative polyketide hydroxylase
MCNRTEALALEQDEDGETVTLRDLDSGDESEVRAGYVVAADGNRSAMRTQLGIAMRLRTALAQHHHLLPRRLRRAAARSQPGRVLRAQPAAARLLPARQDGRQRLPRRQHGRRGRHAGLGGRRAGGIKPGVSAGVPARGDRGRHADGGRRHRPLAGRGELRRAPPSGPSVPRGRRRARRTANGGFGGNAGVQDAHNRAWKLVAVVKGDAGQGLRDTYDAERLPLSEPTVR